MPSLKRSANRSLNTNDFCSVLRASRSTRKAGFPPLPSRKPFVFLWKPPPPTVWTCSKDLRKTSSSAASFPPAKPSANNSAARPSTPAKINLRNQIKEPRHGGALFKADSESLIDLTFFKGRLEFWRRRLSARGLYTT